MTLERCLRLLLIVICTVSASAVTGQWTRIDTPAETPFRKGRWMTGLEGSISSTTRGGSPINTSIASNEYRMELSADRFIKDRWSVGLAFQASRSNTERLVEIDSESLFIGPTSTYYFMKSPNGSVYARLSVGYFRQRSDTNISQSGFTFEELLEAQGIGVVPTLAYAFVVKDDIVFSMGLSLISSWLDGEVLVLPSGTISSESFYSGSIAFQFGFSVLL